MPSSECRTDDDLIIAEHDPLPASRGAGGAPESMDVLLQLTLPVVLILALVASTQLGALHDRIEELEIHSEAAAAGELLSQLERSVLDLQLQLLLKASAEAAAAEAARLELPAYGEHLPTPEMIAAQNIDPAFRAISVRLVEILNGPRARRRGVARLRADALARFERAARALLVDDPRPGSVRSRSLLRLSPINERRLDEDIHGHLGSLEAAGVRVQLELVQAWLAAPTGDELGERSRGVWSRVVAGEEDEFEAFVNLKVRDLVEHLRADGVPLLDRTLEKAL